MENRDQQEPSSGSGNASCRVMCQLVSPEGDHLGAALYLPQNVGPPQLQEIVNHLLHNEHKLSYAFYIGDEELALCPAWCLHAAKKWSPCTWYINHKQFCASGQSTDALLQLLAIQKLY